MSIATINPTTGETIKTFESLADEVITQKIETAQQTFEHYRHTSFEQRAAWLQAAAQLILDEREQLGKLMTLEMGKPINAAIAEAEKCAYCCHYYAENGAKFLADVPIESEAGRSFIRYQPLGVVLAVMPWNFPFWQVFRFAVPCLMVGNVGLLKHASSVPQCALAIEDIFIRAGFPSGAFQTLLVGSDKVTQIIADERVKAATLTGSEPAGTSLASLAGKHVKKTVLELGGSDPFIVLESADLETAISTAVAARMLNNGQSCIAAKRFIVQESIADEFTQKLVEKYHSLKLGDPLNAETDVGPLASSSGVKTLDQQVQACVAEGAKVLVGGNPQAVSTRSIKVLQKGNFYPPTILADVPPDTPIAKEEFFGPVALLFRVPTINAAIQLANSTTFGLGASAWTTNSAEIEQLISDIEAGSVFINSKVVSDPRLPFGGVKHSGYGRELSFLGIHEFVNIKTVWVK